MRNYSGFLLVLLGLALVSLSAYCGFELHMAHDFPFKAAILLTPAGMLINAMPLEGRSFLSYLSAPALRGGLNIWNSAPIFVLVITIQVLAYFSLCHLKDIIKAENDL